MANRNEFIAGWTGHRNALLNLLDCITDKDLTLKPWDDAMSLSELVLHTSSAMNMFADTVKNGVFTPPTEQKTAETVVVLKKIVEDETEDAKATIEALTDEQLNKIIDFAGMQLPGHALLQLAKDHEIHHKGQLFTYARMAGAKELPNFISR